MDIQSNPTGISSTLASTIDAPPRPLTTRSLDVLRNRSKDTPLPMYSQPKFSKTSPNRANSKHNSLQKRETTHADHARKLPNLAVPAQPKAITIPDFPTVTADTLRALGKTVHDAITGKPVARSGLLVVLDLNGLLLERVAKSGTSDVREVRKTAQSMRPPDLCIGRRYVWLRPHVAELLRYVAARHAVAIWSSATEHTVNALLQPNVVLRNTGLQASEFVFIKSRGNCRKDNVAENGKFATVKFINDLWTDHELCRRYGPRSTILVDDTASKVRANPNSAIIVPEYCAGNTEIDYNSDQSLLWTALLLEYLATTPNILRERYRMPQSRSGLGNVTSSNCDGMRAMDDIRNRIHSAGSLNEFIQASQRIAVTECGEPSVRAFLEDCELPEYVATESQNVDKNLTTAPQDSCIAQNDAKRNSGRRPRPKKNVLVVVPEALQHALVPESNTC